MISFRDTTTFLKAPHGWSQFLAPEIQNILYLVYFQISQNQNYEFLYLKLVMRSILPTDQKELVSLAAFKGAKIKPIPQFSAKYK
jgi:hypothetical protein